MKNEGRGVCDGGIDSFFQMKYRPFVTMQNCLMIAALSELDLVSWLKGGICFTPGQAAWAHTREDFGPVQLRRDTQSVSLLCQKLLLLLCPALMLLPLPPGGAGCL